MLDLRAHEEHEHLLPWNGMPYDIVLVHISLQRSVGGLVPLCAYCFNAYHVACLTAHPLAHTGHSFHGVPDGCGGVFIISGGLTRPLHALHEPLGVQTGQVDRPLGAA